MKNITSLSSSSISSSSPSPSSLSSLTSSPTSSVSDHVVITSGEDLLCSPMNTSCACHYEYQFYDFDERMLLGLVALPIIVFGLCANLTSVRIFTHRVMSSSSINWYLAVLSASDTLILISAFFVLSLPRLGEYLAWWRANYIRFAFKYFSCGFL
ncbi:hypothetical protein KIN20_012511 [Parelaphostrongylus tenuis]|uniref:G-protein coupled receptors family 1 profile domain-containing protein n=1 Tax=Parelaphostrongylus tenuis TaxID=148309 RepID=A0AAD5N147_PARTN|nr:hypothetical protein KIN20_012511 [Parelaphostrongylus tenuis]